MRAIITLVTVAFGNRSRLARLATLGRFLVLVGALVGGFSVLFHLLMEAEGRAFSWITGAYWVLTTMTTLGFGDITFTSDLGRVYSMVVMLTGVVVFQILLTFFVIQYLYLPWTEAQEAARVPRAAPPGTSGQVILTADGELAQAMAAMLRRERIPVVLLGGPPAATMALHDAGLPAIVGGFDDPEAYRAAGIARAALVVATGGETANANAVVTVREVAPEVPVVADSRRDLADHVLTLAGATAVLRRGRLLGEAMARTVPGGRHAVHVIGSFHGLVIAEVVVAGTVLEGATLASTGLRGRGVTVAGMRLHGRFRPIPPDLPLPAEALLVAIGPEPAIEDLDATLKPGGGAPAVLVLGSGRVGRAAVAALERRGIPAHLVERLAERVPEDCARTIGDAADPGVLEAAGLATASDVLITTHDDDLNIFLAILVRRHAPTARLAVRVVRERNVSTLQRSGADAVLSDLTLAAQEVLQGIRPASVHVLSEGVHLVREPVPEAWQGRSLRDLALPAGEGLQVVAIDGAEGLRTSPGPDDVLPAGAELLAIRGFSPGDHPGG